MSDLADEIWVDVDTWWSTPRDGAARYVPAARIEELERERDEAIRQRDTMFKSTADGITRLAEERDRLTALLREAEGALRPFAASFAIGVDLSKSQTLADIEALAKHHTPGGSYQRASRVLARLQEPRTATPVPNAGQFPPPYCTAWEDCHHDGVCRDPQGCGAAGPQQEPRP